MLISSIKSVRFNFKYRLLFIFLLMGLNLAGQNILIIERPGTIKNFKYFQGSQIKLKTISTDTIISGVITLIEDDIIILNQDFSLKITDIKTVYKKRWGFSFLQYLGIFGGLAYVSINTINGLINNDSPVVPSETLIISGSMMAFGIILTPLTTRKIKTANGNWRIIILDFDNLE